MSFKSINEIDRFSYDECQITKIEVDELGLLMELEALIVLPNNSQNTNYTKSFAATTRVRLEKAVIRAMYKEGYRRFDANDKLIEAVPDEELPAHEYKTMLKRFTDCFLYRFTPVDEKNGILGIEIPAEDDIQGIESDIYRLELSYEKAVFSWERFMNRVQE